MKRTIAILLAALMLTGVLTACSGSVGMDDGYAYGNVSTTPNGTINGTNRAYNGSYNGYSSNGSGTMTGNSRTGTGMSGGR